jgi:glycyl-tRNA synthetase beta chain
VNAVLAAGVARLPDVEARLALLSSVRQTQTENFEAVAAGFKRISNILRQAEFEGPGTLDREMLEAGPEVELYNAASRIHLADLESVATLRPFVDRFFDRVMVNVDDGALRQNRLAFLHDLLMKFSTIADFSEIVTAGEK